jgi:hypothetical protein
MTAKFSSWIRWQDRNEYRGIEFPGVYVLAITKDDIANNEFSYLKEIVYVAMTNSLGGRKDRMTQLDNTISQSRLQHGGADRLVFKHRRYNILKKSLYVSFRHFRCSPKESQPADLRKMAKVAALEYQVMAQYAETFEFLPAFNRKDSPKLSREERDAYRRNS